MSHLDGVCLNVPCEQCKLRTKVDRECGSTCAEPVWPHLEALPRLQLLALASLHPLLPSRHDKLSASEVLSDAPQVF